MCGSFSSLQISKGNTAKGTSEKCVNGGTLGVI